MYIFFFFSSLNYSSNLSQGRQIWMMNRRLIGEDIGVKLKEGEMGLEREKI